VFDREVKRLRASSHFRCTARTVITDLEDDATKALLANAFDLDERSLLALLHTGSTQKFNVAARSGVPFHAIEATIALGAQMDAQRRIERISFVITGEHKELQ
jgi:uncharacterized tellurite resistance protein B-like protein